MRRRVRLLWMVEGRVEGVGLAVVKERCLVET